MFAEEAVSAGHRERNDDPVTFLYIGYGFSSFCNDSHGLMSENKSRIQGRNPAVDQMEIGAADGRGSHFYDDIILPFNPWVRNLFHSHIFHSVINNRIHNLYRPF